MTSRKKVAVIGLDSVPPELLFGKHIDKLPNVRRMCRDGLRGNLLSCHPPITIPAWMVMMTGKNPGKLGIYGFRHRKGFSYREGYVVNSRDVKEKTVWESLSGSGRSSIVLGVPPSYPPKPVKNCNIVSCFITPGIDRDFTHPSGLKDEVLKACGGKYIFDVRFRTSDRESLKNELFEMTRKRFDVAEYLVTNKQWDFFIMHEIGFDRLHHAFWKFFDSNHEGYVKGNRYEKVDEDYYRMVDERIGRLLGLFGEDCTTFVLSDHGSKSTRGAFCVNQWLEQEGYLKFASRPRGVTDFEKARVDWRKTKAWGWGGYYARIFFNVKGREEQGVIEPKNVKAEKKELAGRMASIPDDEGGRMMNNLVFEPDELYGAACGDKPDLMVYFDELNWRSAGTVGHDSLYLYENDTGPDDSVHSMEGVFLMHDPRHDQRGSTLEGARIEDIAPTLLRLFGLNATGRELDGRVLPEVVARAR